MSPTDLKNYLEVARKAGVMSLAMKINGNEFAVQFGPESVPAFGDEPTPGGWKSNTPMFLDGPAVTEEDI